MDALPDRHLVDSFLEVEDLPSSVDFVLFAEIAQGDDLCDFGGGPDLKHVNRVGLE